MKVAGALLIAISLAAVVQSVREYALWEARANYAEESFLSLPIAFGGHTFTIRDDQPYDSSGSEQEYEGSVQWIRDDAPFESASRARVRRGRNDIGRYHLWLDTWKFKEHTTGQTTLWLVRRLQPVPGRSPRFEVITVDERGSMHVERLRAWQLGRSFPLFRATQFVRSNSSAIPLSVLDGLVFPPVLVAFPFGTFALGLVMLFRGGRTPARRSPETGR